MNQGLANGEALGSSGKELARLTDFGAGDIHAASYDVREQPACESERRLYLAVLEEAFDQYRTALKHLGNGRQGTRYGGVVYLYRGVVDELEQWFASDDEEWPCSFASICNIVGYDIGYLRRRLRRIRDDAERSIPGLDCVEPP